MPFQPLAVARLETRRLQGIEHVVGEQHAAPGLLRRRVDPVHPRCQTRRQRGADALALTLAQIGAGFEYLVPRRQGNALVQRLHHEIGRWSCRESVCRNVSTTVVALSLITKYVLTLKLTTQS